MKSKVFFALIVSFVLLAGSVKAQTPADVLDLSLWKLTLPIGKAEPVELRPPDLSTNEFAQYYFVQKEPLGVVFRAHCGGVTTKGSSYPRCELRQMKAKPKGGVISTSWNSSDQQIHTMTMKVAITKTPAVKKHVVCAQIHDADDDLVMIRLEGTKLFIERGKSKEIYLTRKYELGTPFDIRIQGGKGHVKVWYNGALAMDWEIDSKGCYFKAGCYTQSNLTKGDKTDDYGEVVIYALNMWESK